MFRYCTKDKINCDNNILQKVRQSERKNTIKTDIDQPLWWAEYVHQAWLVTETATKI